MLCRVGIPLGELATAELSHFGLRPSRCHAGGASLVLALVRSFSRVSQTLPVLADRGPKKSSALLGGTCRQTPSALSKPARTSRSRRANSAQLECPDVRHRPVDDLPPRGLFPEPDEVPMASRNGVRQHDRACVVIGARNLDLGGRLQRWPDRDPVVAEGSAAILPDAGSVFLHVYVFDDAAGGTSEVAVQSGVARHRPNVQPSVRVRSTGGAARDRG